jgi:hypothetical protein
MFIAVLIARLWKQPRCPTTDEWINKIYLYTMKFHSATKKNEFLSFRSEWMELENIILSEVNRFRRPKIACSPLYVDYGPKTNAVILLDMGHTLGRMCMGGIGKRKETSNLKLNMVDVFTIEEQI